MVNVTLGRMWNVAIIGGGIAGLAAAYRVEKAAEAAGRPISWCLIEGSPRCGGKIVSERLGPFLVEGGPDAVIPQKPWALSLMRDLGLEDRLLSSNDTDRQTYVFSNGRLIPLPSDMTLMAPGARDILSSPLFSWPGKMRLLAERWIPARQRRSENDDESVADFFRRRLGQEGLERLAGPLLGHIYMADVERMSLNATYPKLRMAELEAGSLTAAKAQLLTGSRAKKRPLFWSLRGGMRELADALVARLPPEALLTGHRVRNLDPVRGGYQLTLDDGSTHSAENVVLAVPSFVAAELMEPVDAELAARFAAIRYVSLATLSLGFQREDIGRQLDGFGYFALKERGEQRTVLASTWTSTKFDHRTDEDHVLVRLFLGEPGSDEMLAEDDELIANALREVSEVLQTRAAPVMKRLHRWPRGYPQYEVGHRERVAAIESGMPPGLVVAGSPYHGVGLPDCIHSAEKATATILERLGLPPLHGCGRVDGAAVAC